MPRYIHLLQMFPLSFSVLHTLSCSKPLSVLLPYDIVLHVFHVFAVITGSRFAGIRRMFRFGAGIPASRCRSFPGGEWSPRACIPRALRWLPDKISSLRPPFCFGCLWRYTFTYTSFPNRKRWICDENHKNFTVSKHCYHTIIRLYCPSAKVYLCIHIFVISDKKSDWILEKNHGKCVRLCKS